MNKEQELYLYTVEQEWDEERQNRLGLLIKRSNLLSHSAALDVLKVAEDHEIEYEHLDH